MSAARRNRSSRSRRRKTGASRISSTRSRIGRKAGSQVRPQKTTVLRPVYGNNKRLNRQRRQQVSGGQRLFSSKTINNLSFQLLILGLGSIALQAFVAYDWGPHREELKALGIEPLLALSMPGVFWGIETVLLVLVVIRFASKVRNKTRDILCASENDFVKNPTWLPPCFTVVTRDELLGYQANYLILKFLLYINNIASVGFFVMEVIWLLSVMSVINFGSLYSVIALTGISALSIFLSLLLTLNLAPILSSETIWMCKSIAHRYPFLLWNEKRKRGGQETTTGVMVLLRDDKSKVPEKARKEVQRVLVTSLINRLSHKTGQELKDLYQVINNYPNLIPGRWKMVGMDEELVKLTVCGMVEKKTDEMPFEEEEVRGDERVVEDGQVWDEDAQGYVQKPETMQQYENPHYQQHSAQAAQRPQPNPYGNRRRMF